MGIRLKAGDAAYYIARVGSKPVPISITGDCEMGDGYMALENGAEIHTCDGSVFKTKQEARRQYVKDAKSLRQYWVVKQTEAQRNIKWIDYIVQVKGKV